MGRINDVIKAIEDTTGCKVVKHGYKKRDFPDSNLGLGKKGEFAAQVITPGYEVDVRLKDPSSGKEYRKSYHSNLEGSILKEK